MSLCSGNAASSRQYTESLAQWHYVHVYNNTRKHLFNAVGTILSVVILFHAFKDRRYRFFPHRAFCRYDWNQLGGLSLYIGWKNACNIVFFSLTQLTVKTWETINNVLIPIIVSRTDGGCIIWFRIIFRSRVQCTFICTPVKIKLIVLNVLATALCLVCITYREYRKYHHHHSSHHCCHY